MSAMRFAHEVPRSSGMGRKARMRCKERAMPIQGVSFREIRSKRLIRESRAKAGNTWGFCHFTLDACLTTPALPL